MQHRNRGAGATVVADCFLASLPAAMPRLAFSFDDRPVLEATESRYACATVINLRFDSWTPKRRK